MKKHTVLFVDDEQNILQALARLLRKEEYRVITANSAKEGLEVLKSENISLIVSDHRMPEMSGLEFMREVKQQYPKIVRIILSGYTEVSAIIAAINEGKVYKYITKPWNDEELKLTIRHSLDQFELKEENEHLVREIKKINGYLEKIVEDRTRDLLIRNKILMLSQNILEILPIAIIGISDNGMISLVNNKGHEIFQQGEVPILGLNIKEIFSEEMVGLINDIRESGVGKELKRYTINTLVYDILLIPFSFAAEARGVVVTLTRK